MIVEELDDRARPPVRDDQRERVGLGRRRVEEVHARAVDLGEEVVERVEPSPRRAASRTRRASTRRARRGSRARCRSPTRRRGAARADACAPRRSRRSSSRHSGIVDRNGSMARSTCARRYRPAPSCRPTIRGPVDARERSTSWTTPTRSRRSSARRPTGIDDAIRNGIGARVEDPAQPRLVRGHRHPRRDERRRDRAGTR